MSENDKVKGLERGECGISLSDYFLELGMTWVNLAEIASITYLEEDDESLFEIVLKSGVCIKPPMSTSSPGMSYSDFVKKIMETHRKCRKHS